MLHCADKGSLYAFDMTLGKRISAARSRLRPRVTQKAVGKAFRITDQAVSQWERDETIPDLNKLPRLARLLKVPVTWLLEGTGPPPAEDAVETQIEALSPEDRAAVGAMIRALHAQRGQVA